MPIAQPRRSAPVAVEHKTFAAPAFDMPEDEPGTIKAIVAVFSSVDQGGDRIRPGFFAKSLARKLPKGVWGHDWLSPVAKTLEARELYPGDPELPPGLMELGGLFVKGQFNLATQRGREAYEDVKFGTIDEFSFGYRVTESETDKKSGVRELIEGDIFEWSPVLAGMHSRTRLLSVKSQSAKATDPVPGKAFSDRSAEVVQAVGEFVERVEGRAQARFKAGRVLSQANFDSIVSVADAMDASCARLRGILDSAVPKRADEPASAAKADDAASIEVPSVPPAAGDATPAVPIETPEAVEVVPEPVPGPAPSSLVLSELARFEATVAASLGVPVGS